MCALGRNTTIPPATIERQTRGEGGKKERGGGRAWCGNSAAYQRKPWPGQVKGGNLQEGTVR